MHHLQNTQLNQLKNSKTLLETAFSKGIYNSIKIVSKLDPNVRLVFITDGHEAPPISPAYRPRFDRPEKQIKGLSATILLSCNFKLPEAVFLGLL